MQLSVPLILEDWEDFLSSGWRVAPVAKALPFSLAVDVLFVGHTPESVFERANPKRPAREPVDREAFPEASGFSYRAGTVLNALEDALELELHRLLTEAFLLTRQFPVVGDCFLAKAGVETKGDPYAEGGAGNWHYLRRWQGYFVVSEKYVATNEDSDGLVLHLELKEAEVDADGYVRVPS